MINFFIWWHLLVFLAPSDLCDLKCTRIFKPVCGSDGNTYNNKCLLDREKCVKRLFVQVAKSGPCENENGDDNESTMKPEDENAQSVPEQIEARKKDENQEGRKTLSLDRWLRLCNLACKILSMASAHQLFFLLKFWKLIYIRSERNQKTDIEIQEFSSYYSVFWHFYLLMALILWKRHFWDFEASMKNNNKQLFSS